MSKPKDGQQEAAAAPAPASPPPAQYRATEGFNHPLVGGPIQAPDKKAKGGHRTVREGRVEAGDVVPAEKLPAQTIAWGLANGVLKVEPPPPPGSVSLTDGLGEAGNLSLAQDGQLSEVKE